MELGLVPRQGDLLQPPKPRGPPHPTAPLSEPGTMTLLCEGPGRPACPAGDISLHTHASCLAPSRPTSNAPPTSAKRWVWKAAAIPQSLPWQYFEWSRCPAGAIYFPSLPEGLCHDLLLTHHALLDAWVAKTHCNLLNVFSSTSCFVVRRVMICRFSGAKPKPHQASLQLLKTPTKFYTNFQ